MPYPANFRFTTEHEWVETGAPEARIGITDYAQQQLGDIVFVELPAVGSKLTAGEAFGTVESVKAVSEVFAPVSGTVVEINESLGRSPELVNSEPHAGGWLVRIKPAEAEPASKLMDAAAYEKFVSEQKHD